MSVELMTDSTCPACAAPIASDARSCRACGAVVTARPAATATGRRVLLDAGLPPRPASETPAPPPRKPAPLAAPRPRSRPGTGPVAAGTVTGDVVEHDVAAVGAREIRHVAAAGVIAVAAVVALLLTGAGGLMFLLPTLVVVAVLLAAPFLIPRARACTPQLRFRITEVSSRVLDCELLGHPDRPPPARGDVVEVFGRAGAVVHADEIVRGGERLHGRPSIAFHIAHHAGTVALGLAAVCAMGVAVLVLTA